MRRVAFVLGVFVTLGSAAVACEESSSSSPGGVTPEGGGGLESGVGNDSAVSTEDASGTDSAADAGADAATDASDGGALNALFAHIDKKLVAVNPTTGALTDVGTTNQEWIVLAWDDTAKVARVVLDPYSPVNGAAAPKLGTINLCDGTITEGPAITLGGVQVRRVESLAQHPSTGVFHIGFGTTGTGAATEFLSERNGTVDVTTGAVTAVGMHQTHQDDADTFTFVGSVLRLLDVATTNNTGSLYVLDPVTGNVSAPLLTGPNLLRVAYDKTRDVVFTAFGTGADPNAASRSIGKLNLTTGANTPLGTVLAADTYGNTHFNGLVSAPPPVCP